MWRILTSIAVSAGLALALLTPPAEAQTPPSGDKNVIRIIPSTDLRSLDPVWTTADITRDYAYMVYDTLFALDSEGKPHPQMVDRYEVSPDKLTYTFTLRDGLKWHDGTMVRAQDCVQSLDRWMKRDTFGQKLAEAIGRMEAIDDRSFRIVLKAPFPLLIDALGKISNNVPFMMPERVARTDPFKQMDEAIGSGPFKMVKEEWIPGSKVVFVRNADYVPRREAADFASGGKVAKVERVEWLVIPDSTTAVAAFAAGEADIYQRPPFDLLPVLRRSPGVTVASVDPLGSVAVLRMNQLLPPFDNPKMRQALLYLVDQRDFMTAAVGSEKDWHVCAALFICGTTFATTAGADALLGPKNLDKAKALMAEAGYKGERVVVMDPTDQPVIHAATLVAADMLTRAGVNVDLQAMDWGTLVGRRASKDPLDKGGWNIFVTTFSGWDMVYPVLNSPLRSNGAAAYFGWPTDQKIEDLRDAWLRAPDLETQRKIAADIQVRAYETVPYILLGQFETPISYHADVKGIIKAPVLILWNVEKT